MSKAGLWAWFLFESGLGAQRAKELLVTWELRGWTLGSALDRAAGEAGRLGLTSAEARSLVPPGLPPAIDALTWDDALYPAGLTLLPIRLRPALLFYRGDPALLMRPIIYLPPAELTSEDVERLREIVNLLMGEDLIFAVFDESPQSAVLLEELAYGQGEALIFAAMGLASREASRLEAPLAASGRLLTISPLPPHTPRRPEFATILQQVAAAAADRMILSGVAARHPSEVLGLGGTPALALTDAVPGVRMPPNVQPTDATSGALNWMGLGPVLSEPVAATDPVATAETQALSTPDAPENRGDTYGLPEDDPGPPPSPEEILNTLNQGGKIPDVLRKRLEDRSD